MVIVGNILSFIACCFIIIGTQAKTYKHTMMWQALDATFFTLSNIFLCGWSGVLTNGLGAIRAVCCYNGELKRPVKIGFILATVLLGLLFHDSAWYGVLPIVASVGYSTVVLYTTNIKSLKVAMIVNNLLWGLYSMLISNYVNALFSPLAAVSCFISLIRVCREQRDKTTTTF